MDNYTYELILSDSHIKAGKIDIPVNFKDKFNIKFAYWALMDINGVEYKVYIQEKDPGLYEIRKNIGLVSKFKSGEKLKITIKPQEPIYCKESPYTYDNPVRSINSVIYVKEPTGYLCGQTCVAMLAAKPVDEVIEIMCTDRGTHVEHIKAALEYYGIKHSKSRIKYKEGMELPNICILDLKLPSYGHWSLHFNGQYYDPEFGILDKLADNAVLKRFLEIMP